MSLTRDSPRLGNELLYLLGEICEPAGFSSTLLQVACQFSKLLAAVKEALPVLCCGVDQSRASVRCHLGPVGQRGRYAEDSIRRRRRFLGEFSLLVGLAGEILARVRHLLRGGRHLLRSSRYLFGHRRRLLCCRTDFTH